MDNPKVVIGTNRFGKCLIARASIQKGEHIAEFDGETFEAEKCTDLPEDIANHAIQFAEHKWKDSNGIARYINHSCNPNCGIHDSFSLFAIRDIQEGEELTWDYGMTEDSDWRMKCLCGSPVCRKVIGSFVLVPDDVRKKFREYISDWLVKKYHL